MAGALAFRSLARSPGKSVFNRTIASLQCFRPMRVTGHASSDGACSVTTASVTRRRCTKIHFSDRLCSPIYSIEVVCEFKFTTLPLEMPVPHMLTVAVRIRQQKPLGCSNVAIPRQQRVVRSYNMCKLITMYSKLLFLHHFGLLMWCLNVHVCEYLWCDYGCRIGCG